MSTATEDKHTAAPAKEKEEETKPEVEDEEEDEDDMPSLEEAGADETGANAGADGGSKQNRSEKKSTKSHVKIRNETITRNQPSHREKSQKYIVRDIEA